MFHSIFCGTNGLNYLFFGFILPFVYLPFVTISQGKLSILQITPIRSADQFPINVVTILGLQFLLQQTVLIGFEERISYDDVVGQVAGILQDLPIGC